jgi:hypothetical protein
MCLNVNTMGTYCSNKIRLMVLTIFLNYIDFKNTIKLIEYLLNYFTNFFFNCIFKVHDGIKLKISTNSTRRVRWYTKLGFYKNASLPIPITLESVLPRGGIIGSLSLIILRKYPMMYFERRTNSKSSMYYVHFMLFIIFVYFYYNIFMKSLI